MFYVSHDKDEILEIADWVIVIERGQVERAGEPCSTLSEHA
jgi:ABC-type molybdate transport system ATPase subunit